MNAKQIAEAQALYETACRLERVGLIVDRTALTPEHRRAAFALQCLALGSSQRSEPKPAAIGFAYPNAR